MANEEDMAKIRTLDLSVHFDMEPPAKKTPSAESLTYHVEIFERFAEKFAAIGSTIEHDLMKMIENFSHMREKHPLYVAPTGYIVAPNGLSLNRFTVSFVNRQLL